MKSLCSIVLIFSLIIASCAQNDSKSDEVISESDGEVTTFYLIRHAEKDRSDETNTNPNLTNKGKNRAERWREELADVNFHSIYSTDYNRTKETAAPLANHNRLEVKIYDPSLMQDASFIDKYAGKNVLIVGHSNTTPMFANALLGNNKYEEMDDRNNANLYIVTIKDGKATAELRRVE